MQALKFSVKVITKIQTAATQHEIMLKPEPNRLFVRYLNAAIRHPQFANRELIGNTGISKPFATFFKILAARRLYRR